jgi:hypothetical protein
MHRESQVPTVVPRTVPFGAVLAAIAASAAALALVLRRAEGLTVDEPFMANALRLPWPELWAAFAVDNVPFSYLVWRGWTAAFGESEIALRSVSALAYGGAIVLTGLAAKRAAGAAAGLSAALLLAASQRAGLEHAATARPYALLALAAAAAALQTISLLQLPREGVRRAMRLGLLALTHLLGLFTHPIYVVMAAASAIGALATERWRSGLVVAPAVAVAAYTALWGHMVLATIALRTTSWMKPPRAGDVLYALGGLWGPVAGLLVLTAIVVSIWSSRANIRRVTSAPAERWIVTAAGAGWILPVVVSFWKPIFEPTRTPALLLPLTCLLVATVTRILAGARPALALALVCSLLTLFTAAVVPRDAPPTGQSLAQLLRRARCGDTVIAPGLALTAVQYYFRRLDAPGCIRSVGFPENVVDWAARLRDPMARRALEDEAAALARAEGGRVWLLGRDAGTLHEANAIAATVLRREMACGQPEPLPGAFFDSVMLCEPSAALER